MKYKYEIYVNIRRFISQIGLEATRQSDKSFPLIASSCSVTLFNLSETSLGGVVLPIYIYAAINIKLQSPQQVSWHLTKRTLNRGNT